MRPRRCTRLVPLPPAAPPGAETVRPGRGVLVRLPDLSADAARNAAWDDLLACADWAWTFRDPDSLSAVGICLLQLARDVLPEWGDAETAGLDHES
jgi:hypothetical protein